MSVSIGFIAMELGLIRRRCCFLELLVIAAQEIIELNGIAATTASLL